MVLSGLSINVPIPLSDQPLIVLWGVHLIDNGGIIHRNGNDVPFMAVQDGTRSLPGSRRIVEEVLEQYRAPNDRVTAALSQSWHDDRRFRTSMSVENAVDGGDPHVGQVDRPDEHRCRLDCLEGAYGRAERGDWTCFWLGILRDDAVVACQNRLDPRGIRPKHHDPGFDFEGFERFQNANDKRKP